MRLAAIVQASDDVAATRARKRKIERLAECLSALVGDERDIGVAFLSGELRQGRIGLGWAALRDAAPPGAAAEASLDLVEVDAAFAALADVKGKGSAARRAAMLGELLAAATAPEQAFIAKLVMGELRQGALEGVLLEAVARAADVPAVDVRRAAMLGGSLRAVSLAALEEGLEGLARFRLELFRPIQPMLASPSEGVADVLERLGRAALEFKLDGARIQAHRLGDEVRVFSRRGNDVTPAVPEVAEALAALDVASVVLDGEAIAFRPDGRPQPFQTTMRRFGRRLDVEAMRRELPLGCRFFDCLHVDGVDLLDRPAAERFEALARCVPESLRVERLETDAPADANALLERALDAGHEGLVAKSLDAPYAAGRRGAEWLKIKPTHTLDLVVLAAEWGSGRRKGWLSNLHLGARDGTDFAMLGKTFKGLTDELLTWQTDQLLALELHRDRHVVHVKPQLVVEIAFDGVQSSPHYPAGLALRFARVKRYRPDKDPTEADTLETVRTIFEA